MSYLPKLDALPDPEERFTLQDVIGTGSRATVYKAIDNQSDGKIVAIKIQQYEDNLKTQIEEEYRVFRDFSNHPNLPEFYGVYLKNNNNAKEIWFIMEYCEGGSVIELVRGLNTLNKRMSEEHIAFIVRETAKALLHLHGNHVIHRDVRADNILLTREGDIKLCDFGLSRDLKSTMGKRGTCIGSPSWMAPEVVTSTNDDDETYGSRSDVWALGITTIEIADGRPPFADMHPTRILFQIVRNPPPTLYRPASWSQTFNDFIAECLEKNQEHRPFLVELMEHPFFTELPENVYFLSQELKVFLSDVEQIKRSKKPELTIYKNFILKHNAKPEEMYVEDLAALDKISEEKILTELERRMENGDSYTFIGDVLLSLNSNESKQYERTFQNKYLYKSRSDNAPHIFAVADSAFQDMLHHEEPQHIVLSGESYSGKTTNFRLLLDHLSILGQGHNEVCTRIKSGVSIITAMVNAGTPINPDSTKCFLQTQLTFGSSGKMSGAIFWVYLLEKLRVSSTDMSQSNFHIFYYFYDGMEAEERLKDFSLESGRKYRYLRIPDCENQTKLQYCRNLPSENVEKFKMFEKYLIELEFSSDQIEQIYNILAAILILGDVRYKTNDENTQLAELENPEVAQQVSNLLKIDEKKFQWALLNYCVVEKGTAERRRHTADEARDARDVLASTIYSRLVDWFVNTINQKLAFSRAVYGDLHSITLIDLFGFECIQKNRIEQLMINCLNEQMQYQFNQREFAYEMIDLEEELVPGIDLHYYNNKATIDQLMSRPTGLFHLIDEISKGRHGHEFLTDSIANKKSPFIKRHSSYEFTIAHYTGKVSYDVREFADKNRDFLPPEMLETLRSSQENIIKIMFTNQLSKTGNLTMENTEFGLQQIKSQKTKWGQALVAEKTSHNKSQKLNTLSHGQYSQVHKMRTLASVFRATSLEILKNLSIGDNTGATHFIRCIRSDLEYKPKNFNTEMIRQQLKAMAIVDTAIAKKQGFSHRIAFQEFLRRYKFLAFEFDENVELTKDNCRLLLIRLKLEGWVIGTSKVFLKYYNEEYLSRLYETQVKKIIKVQSMLRAFLAKRNVASKLKNFKRESETKPLIKQESIKLNEEEAIIRIQKAYRGYMVRKQYGPLINARTGKLDAETAKFVMDYARRWRTKTIYQVLLHYRAARYQDLVNFSQQVHIYNQRLVAGVTTTSQCLLLDRIDANQKNASLFGPQRPPVWKIPFRLDEIPYFDTTYLCDPIQLNSNYSGQYSDDEEWDAPLRRRPTISSDIITRTNVANIHSDLTNTINDDFDDSQLNEPFVRDPNVSIKRRAPRPPSNPINPNTINQNMQVYSPSPYVKQEFNNIREKFNESNVIISNKSASYKKRPAPKAPEEILLPSNYTSHLKKCVAPKRDSSNWSPASGPEFSYTDLESRNKIVSPTQSKINPIKEMQLIAQQNSEERDENDPPFNFQGLLRKTKYNRASMKRSTENKLSVISGVNNIYADNQESAVILDIQNSPKSNIYSNSKIVRSRTPDAGYVKTSKNYTNVVYHSKVPDRPKSSQGNMNTMYLTNTINFDENDNHNEFDNTNNHLKDDANMNINIGPYIKEEIYPGIILEGYVAHI